MDRVLQERHMCKNLHTHMDLRLFLLSHLFVGDWSLLLIGQLHQCADICAEVGLTADE